jgi:hypothetical protein
MQTHFHFSLPRGYVDAAGSVQREGVMRLATAMDEIAPQQDPRVVANEAYLPILLLARVVEQLGSLLSVTPQVIEGLYASDLAYLQDLYLRINAADVVVVGAVCPHCSAEFHIQVAPLIE